MNQLFIFFISVTISFSSSSFTPVDLGKFSNCFDPIDYPVEDSTNTIEKIFSTNEQKMDLKIIVEDYVCDYLRIKAIPTDVGSSAYIYLFENPDDVENVDAAILKSEEQYINQIHARNKKNKNNALEHYLRIQCPGSGCNFKIFFQFQGIPTIGKNEITYIPPISLISGPGIQIQKDDNTKNGKHKFSVFLHFMTISEIEEVTMSLTCRKKEGVNYDFLFLSINQHFITNENMFIIDESKLSCSSQGNYLMDYVWRSYCRYEVSDFYSDNPEITLNTTVHHYLAEGENKEECFNINGKEVIEENYYTIGVESMTNNIQLNIFDEKKNIIPDKTLDVSDKSRKTTNIKGKDLIKYNICFKTLDSKFGGFSFQIIDKPPEEGNQTGGNPSIEGKASKKKSKTGLIVGVCVAVVVVLGGAGGVAVYFLKIRKIKTNQSSVKEIDPSRLDTDRPMNSEQIEPTKVEVKQSKL